MRLLRCLLALPVAALLLAGCADTDSARGPVRTELPDEIAVFLDQSRLQLKGRTVFVRLVNDGGPTVTVTRAVVTSPRFAKVVLEEDATFENETDLEFELPPGRCGAGSDAEVELTYRLDGDEGDRVSTVTAEDRYGAIAYFLQRDCAEQTLREAADLVVGAPKVVGRAHRSVLLLPVTLSPTGGRDGLRFRGFEGTPLFGVGGPWTGEHVDVPVGGGTEPVELELRIVPARCDPHALAEDKVGTLFGVRLSGAGLPEESSFYLPLSTDTKARLLDFWATRCAT